MILEAIFGYFAVRLLWSASQGNKRSADLLTRLVKFAVYAGIGFVVLAWFLWKVSTPQ